MEKNTSPDHVTVRIYGESYTLRTGEDPSYVEEIARYIDARMREAASSGKVVVTSKIAVLAAMHIADEFFRLRRDSERERIEVARRTGDLVETIDRALASANTPLDLSSERPL